MIATLSNPVLFPVVFAAICGAPAVPPGPKSVALMFAAYLFSQNADLLALMPQKFSFAAPIRGIEHSIAMPEAPPPDTILPRDVALLVRHDGQLPKNVGVPWPIDLRHVARRQAGQ